MTAERAFGLYVHWPFCAAKCPYCDFNSHVAKGPVAQDRWAAALVREIGRLGRELPGRRLGSIFFGGGTPSLMPPSTVAAVIDAAADAWAMDAGTEITMEANPTSVEAARLDGYRAAGVNRLSLGVQALDDAALAALGRQHSVAEALRAVEAAQRCVARVSFDLIYARQDQTERAWRDELSAALRMGTQHLSLYQLTIEPGTAFGRRHAVGRLPGLPGEDRAADLWEATQALCTAAGLPGYEISNHAVPGQECRHNLGYWRQHDWAGVGPGAHGRLTLDGCRVATEAHADPARWLAAVDAGSGECRREAVPGVEHGTEVVLMGLRLREGIDLRGVAATGLALPEDAVAELAGLGMVRREGTRLLLTEAGRPLLDAILRRLLT